MRLSSQKEQQTEATAVIASLCGYLTYPGLFLVLMDLPRMATRLKGRAALDRLKNKNSRQCRGFGPQQRPSIDETLVKNDFGYLTFLLPVALCAKPWTATPAEFSVNSIQPDNVRPDNVRPDNVRPENRQARKA